MRVKADITDSDSQLSAYSRRRAHPSSQSITDACLRKSTGHSKSCKYWTKEVHVEGKNMNTGTTGQEALKKSNA